jgi:oligoendopeptidase F
MDRELSKLYSYASMKFDLDQNNLESQSNMSRLQNFFVIYAQAIAFVDDELLKNNFEDYKTWAKDYEYIKFNMYRLDQLFHSKEHVLKPELEQLLSLYSPITSSFRSTYGLLENADTKPVTVTTSDNKTHTFTKSNYTTLLGEYSNSQEDRKKIFEAFFKHYDDYKNTFAALYKGVVESDIARMKSRGYDNILDTFLDNNKIDKNVYLTLLKTVHENTAPLKRYIEFRKKYFNLKEYHNYDRFLSIARDKTKYPYDYAKADVLDALAPMGDDFVNHAKIALAEGHVDVMPSQGKRSGAYSTEVEGFGPYILLNHTDDLPSLNSSRKVTLQDLINSGLVEAGKINPVTNQAYNLNMAFCIYNTNNNYRYEYKESGEC